MSGQGVGARLAPLLAAGMLAACAAPSPETYPVPVVLSQGVSDSDHPVFAGAVCVSDCGFELLPPTVTHFSAGGTYFVFDRCDGFDIDPTVGRRPAVAAVPVPSERTFVQLPDSTSRYLLLVEAPRGARVRPDPRLGAAGWPGVAITLADRGPARMHVGEELARRGNARSVVRSRAKAAHSRCALLESERLP